MPSRPAPKLVVLGGGRMGEALVKGVVIGGWAEIGEVVVVEPQATRRDQLGAAHPGLVVAERPETMDGAGGAVVAVKPADAEAACRALAGSGITRVVSIAAGVPLGDLRSWLGPGPALLRAMPNTPALVGAGVSALAAGPDVGEADLVWAEGVLGAVGAVVRLPEALLDAVTGLSGSGPAYVFLVAEALIDGGVLAGLPHSVSRDLTVQTLLGAAQLLDETGEAPTALRAAVTSPGGTTAAGVRVLERQGVRSALMEAVVAATERSRELGRGR